MLQIHHILLIVVVGGFVAESQAQIFSTERSQRDVSNSSIRPDSILVVAGSINQPPLRLLLGSGLNVNVNGFSYGRISEVSDAPLLDGTAIGFSVDRFATGVTGSAVAQQSALLEVNTDVFRAINGNQILLHDGDNVGTQGLAEPLGLREVIGNGVSGFDSAWYGHSPQRIYWSVDDGTIGSALPYDGLSAADVFVDLVPANAFAASPTLFATHGSLGLAASDDIDALEVFDAEPLGVLDSGDTILFSLDPNSPTLLAFGFTPGDVLRTKLGGPISLYVAHGGLGLASDDNVRALSFVSVPETLIAPEGQKLLDGLIAAGTIGRLAVNDNQYLELEPVPTINPAKQKVHLILQSTSFTAVPTTFGFQMESKMAGIKTIRRDVVQSIHLLNYVTGQFELVDTRIAHVNDDMIHIVPHGDHSRFVQAGTLEMTASITWKSESFVGDPFEWTIDVDQAVFVVTE